ncbi:MAG: hypothetical protein KDI55_28110 [Anaerolineae bacterium]|nr:hypothetical protein [Anaerolineae bacterium]
MTALILFIALCTLLGATFLLFPSRMLILHSSLMKLVHGDPEDPDNAVDNWAFPWERWMLGSKREFMLFGPKTPSQFPKMLIYYRLMGIGFLVPAFLALDVYVLSR